MEKYIISHKNPDTDTIISAIVYSYILEKQGIDAKPIRLGDLNNETKFVLEKFGFNAPEIETDLPAGSQVYLVDHNEESQSIDNLSELIIAGIVDHHAWYPGAHWWRYAGGWSGRGAHGSDAQWRALHKWRSGGKPDRGAPGQFGRFARHAQSPAAGGAQSE